MSDGLLLYDKPAGVTSHDVVARVRRRFGRGVKVGHAGTLDPFATGLLLVLLGRATRVQRFLMALPKRYEAVARFGAVSSTGDPEGAIKWTGVVPGGDLELPQGVIRQRPPAYSAVKISGRRAYALARAGEAVQLPERSVSVYRFEERWRDGPRRGFVIECSSGTYVRSLIAELGDAYCEALRRVRIGSFDVADADADVDGDLDPQRVVGLGQALRFLPEVRLGAQAARRARHGGAIRVEASGFEEVAEAGFGETARSAAAAEVGEAARTGEAAGVVGEAARTGEAAGVVRLTDEDGIIALARRLPDGRTLRPVVGFRG